MNRLHVALGTLLIGGVAISNELDLTTTWHKVVLLVAGVVLFLLDPEDQSPTLPETAPASATKAQPPI
jgi:hypothetical protein